MKTLTKKAIVLASAIAVAGAFAVCAASYSAVEPTAEGKSVTVDFSTDVADTDQITMLAYYVGDVDLGPNEYNIVFIEQLQKSEAGSSITFSLRDDDPTTGTYKVLMGGTGISKAGEGTFTLESTPTGATISGTVDSLAYFGDPEGDEFLEQANTDYQTVATLWNGEWSFELTDTSYLVDEVVVDASTVPEAIEGKGVNTFTFDGVSDGDYFISLTRAGKCTKIIPLSVSGDNVNVGDNILLGADTNEDWDISARDVSDLIDSDKNYYGDDTFAILCDENGDGSISAIDLSNTIDSLLSFNYDSYHGLN